MTRPSDIREDSAGNVYKVDPTFRDGEDDMECPMCGGTGRLVNVTAAIEEAQAAGTLLIPLRPSSLSAVPGTETEPENDD